MDLIRYEDKIKFVYYFSEYYHPDDWVKENLNNEGKFSFKRIFKFKKSDEILINGDEEYLDENFISKVNQFLYLQLISDLINNRAEYKHIAPAINKLKSF